MRLLVIMFDSFFFVTAKHVNSCAVVKTRLDKFAFACVYMHVLSYECESTHMNAAFYCGYTYLPS